MKTPGSSASIWLPSKSLGEGHLIILDGIPWTVVSLRELTRNHGTLSRTLLNTPVMQPVDSETSVQLENESTS